MVIGNVLIDFMCKIYNINWVLHDVTIWLGHKYSRNLLFRLLRNGVYKLKYTDSSEEYPVYCHMAAIPGCQGGGWTLVMKIDGNRV